MLGPRPSGEQQFTDPPLPLPVVLADDNIRRIRVFCIVIDPPAIIVVRVEGSPGRDGEVLAYFILVV